MNKIVFITGGTGYIGSRLIPRLIEKGYTVNALVRIGSEKKLPAGTNPIFGSIFDSRTFVNQVKGADTFIQLVGVAHPSPSKGKEFNKIDLVSVTESVKTAKESGIKHFVYLSVSHPAPIMHEYINVRKQGEEMIWKSGMNASFIRPWYVLGPGHYWPYLFLPILKLFQLFPPTRKSALRLDTVKINQMIKCLVNAVENPPEGTRILKPQDIKTF